MAEGGGGAGGPVVAALKPPLRQLERNPLLVIHALKRSAAYLDGAAHVIGFQDGRNVVKLPNGASLLPLGPGNGGALFHPRGVPQTLSGSAASSQGALKASDHLGDYRVRTGDDKGAEEGLNTVARSRIWDIGFGPLGPAGALLAESLGGGSRGPQGLPLVPSEYAASKRGIVHTLVGDCHGGLRKGTCASLSFDDTLTPQAVRLELAARRLLAMGEQRVALAGTSTAITPLDAWPKSVTSLADTWWQPYLRPAAMRVPPKAAKRKAKPTDEEAAAMAAAGIPQALPPSQQEQDLLRQQQEAEMQAQYDAQMVAQEYAEREARKEAASQTKEWLKQAWLISNVRSTLYYALRGMDEEEEDIPLLRPGLNAVPMALPREAPQDSFLAGYPDAVQEIYTQAPLELCAVPEGLQKPTSSQELQVRGPDGEKKRPTLTAQVTRIRGSAASAFGFTGLGADIGPNLVPLGQSMLDPITGLPAQGAPTSALAA